MAFYYRSKYTALAVLVSLVLIGGFDVLGYLEAFKIDEATMKRAEAQYGPLARKRLLAWEKLILSGRNAPQPEKLKQANSFCNLIRFTTDLAQWNKKDYWATPVEFLASNGGDCEDFSVAKYFTLRAMGIPDHKLYLTYVKALRPNQAHMVLAYYAQPDAEPLILDNLVGEIQPAGKRKDLLPVYSFNGSGLWIAKQRGNGKLVGNSNRLKRWWDLMERLPQALRMESN